MSTQIPSSSQAWRYPPDHSTWDSYRSLELKDVPVPAPGKGEVLVKIYAVSLNYRCLSKFVDILTGSGSYPLPLTDGPDGQGFIPTSDCAGDIVSIGPDVVEWKIGDRVHSLFVEGWMDGPLQPELWSSMLGAGIQGCLSQYRVFPAESVLRVPAHLSYEQAATIPCAGATAWNALFGSRPISKNSTVLVQGSGGVSVFAAQIAKAAGARVIATTSSQTKAERYKTLGVDHVINYRETPEWSTKVKELTDGQGVDDVVEVGGDATLVQSIKSLKQRGHIHIVGFLAKPEPDQATGLSNVASLLILPEATIRGVAIGSKVLTQQLDDFLEKHKIEPVVDPKVFEWSKVIDAIAYLESGAHFGKVIVRVN